MCRLFVSGLEECKDLKIVEKAESKIGSSYFLPHRPVVTNENITKKIRPVFDASSRESGKSFNHLLYTGPNLLEHISDILDSFRSYPIGVSAGIEKAFHQLGISFEQRDFLRFFYPKEGEEIIYRHCRVVIGVSSSPFSFSRSFVTFARNTYPIGLLSSVTLLPKILLQKAWNLNLNWNSILPDDILNSYKKWLKEIKLLFPKSDWRHIPGNMNPADHISRRCSLSKLFESRWRAGPLWLLQGSHT
ncbi:uncharacterized protein TNCV_2934901 [Trichonephila clavipes]|nr:uncharacterized protein TNCV_2934901 [Trichonephila clavipes]